MEGQIVSFLFELGFAIALLVVMSRTRQGQKVPSIRKVAGLDAIEESVGRATEMGRPIHFSPGIGDFGEPMTLAAFNVLQYVSRMEIQYDARLIVTNRNPVVYPVTESIVRESYAAAGKLDSFDPTDVRYLSSDQFGYASGVVGILHREKVAANLMFGLFYAESLIFAEAGNQAGSIQIAGTAYVYQIPMFVAACDYTMIGDELYAASAYVSGEPIIVANLIAQDWGKMAAAVFILIGVLFRTFGSDIVIKILSV